LKKREREGAVSFNALFGCPMISLPLLIFDCELHNGFYDHGLNLTNLDLSRLGPSTLLTFHALDLPSFELSRLGLSTIWIFRAFNLQHFGTFTNWNLYTVFSQPNAPAKLRALSEKQASRQLQPVVRRECKILFQSPFLKFFINEWLYAL
jgi:hypothetical protein